MVGCPASSRMSTAASSVHIACASMVAPVARAWSIACTSTGDFGVSLRSISRRPERIPPDGRRTSANTRGGAAPLGTESQGEFRLGLQVKAAGLRFDAAGIKGLTEFSPRSGVTFGVTYDTPSVFTPVK